MRVSVEDTWIPSGRGLCEKEAKLLTERKHHACVQMLSKLARDGILTRLEAIGEIRRIAGEPERWAA